MGMQSIKLREREGGRGKTLIGQKTKFLQQINWEEKRDEETYRYES